MRPLRELSRVGKSAVIALVVGGFVMGAAFAFMPFVLLGNPAVPWYMDFVLFIMGLGLAILGEVVLRWSLTPRARPRAPPADSAYL